MIKRLVLLFLLCASASAQTISNVTGGYKALSVAVSDLVSTGTYRVQVVNSSLGINLISDPITNTTGTLRIRMAPLPLDPATYTINLAEGPIAIFTTTGQTRDILDQLPPTLIAEIRWAADQEGLSNMQKKQVETVLRRAIARNLNRRRQERIDQEESSKVENP
jgi:hypothetical protein